jgi:hypothetical protein
MGAEVASSSGGVEHVGGIVDGLGGVEGEVAGVARSTYGMGMRVDACRRGVEAEALLCPWDSLVLAGTSFVVDGAVGYGVVSVLLPYRG